MLPRLGDGAVVPVPRPILDGEQALGVLDAPDDMFLLLPDGAPHGASIEPGVQDPGHGHVRCARRDRLTHRGERLLDCVGLAHAAWRFRPEEPVRAHAAPLGRDADDRAGALASDQAAVEVLDPHQVGHGVRVRLAQCSAVGD